jgi:hypothetical protein
MLAISWDGTATDLVGQVLPMGTRVKVTKEVERVIRERTAAGNSIASIARVFGLTRVTVYAVLKRAS